MKPQAIVLHITDGDTAAGALGWFNNPISQVSAHYLVDATSPLPARIYATVHEEDTAWHAGLGWNDQVQFCLDHPEFHWASANLNNNLMTIGIEHVGRPGVPWSPALYDASAGLIANVARRNQIPLDSVHVIRHGTICKKHAACPGDVDLDVLLLHAKRL